MGSQQIFAHSDVNSLHISQACELFCLLSQPCSQHIHTHILPLYITVWKLCVCECVCIQLATHNTNETQSSARKMRRWRRSIIEVATLYVYACVCFWESGSLGVLKILGTLSRAPADFIERRRWRRGPNFYYNTACAASLFYESRRKTERRKDARQREKEKHFLRPLRLQIWR